VELAAGSDRAVLPSSQPRRRLGTSAVWVILGRSLGVAVTTLLNIVLARWLSHEDFGSYLLLTSALGFASVMAMFGLGAALVRFVCESLGRGDVERARHSLRLALSVAAVTIVAVAVAAGAALAYGNDSTLQLPASPWLVPIVVASLVMLAALQLLAEGCRSLQEMRLATLFSGGQTGGLLSNILFLVLIAAAVGLSRPDFLTALVLNAVAMAVCVPAAVAGLAWATRARLGAPRADASESRVSLRPLVAFSGSMLAVQLLTLFTTQADLWIAGVWCQHDQLALYGAARRLMLLVSLPVQMLNLSVVASVAELHGQRRRELERLLRRSATLAAAPSVVAIVLLMLCGGPILELLFGPYFREAALPLAILGVGQLVLVAVGSCGCALEMSGNHYVSLAVNLLASVALVVVGVWAARHFGILGLAIGSASVIALQSISLWLLARRLAGVWTHPTLRMATGAR
jgi:O-antigen/teichoic acid export membrane protein